MEHVTRPFKYKFISSRESVSLSDDNSNGSFLAAPLNAYLNIYIAQ